jgi:hypothetical protein
MEGTGRISTSASSDRTRKVIPAQAVYGTASQRGSREEGGAEDDTMTAALIRWIV